MKKVTISFLTLISVIGLYAQEIVSDPPGGSSLGVTKLPDYVPPSPEASAIIKAAELSVNLSTGSPNFAFPLMELTCSGFKLPITLSYNSTGIKVDEYASMVGQGWTIDYGGIVTRTILGKEDDLRDTYLVTNFDFNNGYPPVSQLESLFDGESDIFNFSFMGYSGKFILSDNRGQVIPLGNYNLKFEFVNNNFLDGFIITTENGISFYFQDFEATRSRTIFGGSCDKISGSVPTRTSWLLTKIVFPSKNKEINFYYTDATITFEHSINQTSTKVVESEINQCTGGFFFGVGGESVSTCVSRQELSAKLISKISTSDGDYIDFFYDQQERQDLTGGKRLEKIKLVNRNGSVLKEILFEGSYTQAINGSPYSYTSKRLFLDDFKILSPSGGAPLTYAFSYIDRYGLPARLTFGQDYYGYNNGRTLNPSLLPILNPNDINYEVFDNGTGGTQIRFGDRSIDTIQAIKGLLNKIVYPTGGYDEISYIANKQGTILAGGFSVFKVQSYAQDGIKAREKVYQYIYKETGVSSTISVTDILLSFSTRHSEYKIYSQSCRGQGRIAVVTSNSMNQLTLMNGQHLYHKNVIVTEKSEEGFNGFTEHNFNFFNGASVDPEVLMNEKIPQTPLRVMPDFVTGEGKTYVYKYQPSAPEGYQLIKKIERNFDLAGYQYYSNYTTRLRCGDCIADIGLRLIAQDVNRYQLYAYTLLPISETETDYADDGTSITNTVTTTYDQYKNVIQQNVVNSKGETGITTYKYPYHFSNADNNNPYTAMMNKNMVSAMVQKLTSKLINGNEYITGGEIHTYQKYSDDKIYNDAIYSFETQEKVLNNSSSFSNTSYKGTITNGELAMDSRFVKKANLHYDPNGNLSTIVKNSSESTSFVWDYSGEGPVMRIASADNIYPNPLTGSNPVITTNFSLSPLPVTTSFTTQTVGSVTINIRYAIIPSTSHNALIGYSISGVDVSFSQSGTVSISTNGTGTYSSVGGQLNNLPVGQYTISTVILSQTFPLSSPYPNSYILDVTYPKVKYLPVTAKNEIAYTSFEADNFGNWEKPVGGIVNGGVTGKKSYNLATGVLTKTGLNNTKTYIVSYWLYTGGTATVAGANTPVAGFSKNGWTYYETKANSVTSISISGSGNIDEVRLYPSDAQMTSYTYEPLIGITSQCDINNRITYYEYDGFNRLVVIRDQDKNIVKRYCYNYAGQPENCVAYRSAEKFGTFTRNNCGEDYVGGSVTYTVPEGTYISFIDQMDADQQAQVDVNNNGQAYANANGTCTRIYTNFQKSGNYTRNNCGANYLGGSVTYIVPAGRYTSLINQEDADQQAQNDVNNNGQNYANTNGACFLLYTSAEKSGMFFRNNCSIGYVGNWVTYVVPAGRYTSIINQQDADQQAQNDVNNNGQAYANTNGTCTRIYVNFEKQGVFTRNNCGVGYAGTSVTYTVLQDTYASFISQEDADQQAQNDVNNNGQAYANTHGTCVSAAPNWQNTATATRCKSGSTTGEIEQEQKDINPYSSTYNQTRWVVVGANCTTCPAPANWQNTATATRCKSGSATCEVEQEQRDVNICSSTYNQTRWIVVGTNCATCPAPANWQNTATATRCKSGSTTGEIEQEQIDINPYSSTYYETRWVVVGTNCTTCPAPANWQNTTTPLRCQKNGSNQNTGYQEQEQRDVNVCSSTYNQTRWVVAGYNTTACPLPSTCNTSNCSGVDKKCVNGVCQTGVKVYISSVKIGSHLWQCTYHYEWSDGTWSQSYTEDSPYECPLAV